MLFVHKKTTVSVQIKLMRFNVLLVSFRGAVFVAISQSQASRFPLFPVFVLS